jgi:hypothetical protein
MKKDKTLILSSSFLVIIVSLYGLFVLFNYFETGFFSLIAAIIIFFTGFLLYKKNIDKTDLKISIIKVSYLIIIILIFYILFLVSVITNNFLL